MRNTRAEHKVDLGHSISARIYAGDLAQELSPYTEAIRFLARAEPVFSDKRPVQTNPEDVVIVLGNADIIVPLRSLIDVEKEKQRLAGEIASLETVVNSLTERLGNEKFLNRAPAAVVEKEQSNLKSRTEKLEKLKTEIKRLLN